MPLCVVSLLTSAAISACGGGSPDQSINQDSAVSVGPTTTVGSATSGQASSASSPAEAASTSGIAASTPSTTTTTATAAPNPPSTVTTTTSSAPGTAVTSTNAGGTSTQAAVVSRPAYNTGSGFYVVGSKLYDSSGHEFRPRGLNRVHWNQSGDDVGIPATGANIERMIMDVTRAPSDNVALMQSQMINQGLVPMPGNWNGTCKADTDSIRAIVDAWVAGAASFTTLDRYSIINIANEWGPEDSTVWRDEYITAIARMRAAGYKGTLSITSGGCGQDQADLIKYAQQVFDSDPEKNILFDVHVYGHYYTTATASWMTAFAPAMAQIAALNLPILVGEYGPGKNLGPSPTMITPQQVVTMAEGYGWGWLAWAYDANDLPNCGASEGSFAIVKSCGIYKTDADLTGYGLTVVPLLKSMATHATIFAK
jgi:mannan endo-1,4-beta-mannosidase